jgi:hydrogenase expression/formation protein HypD
VCVTPVDFVDHAVALATTRGVVVATFGDMLRVPGSRTSLERARARGADVRVVYSPLDALALARADRRTLIAFVAVGFETTAPTTAAAVVAAEGEGLDNFTVLCAHRLVPPALEALLAHDDELRVDAFLAPGHVSAIIGSGPYGFIARDHARPVVIAGFEPEDILHGIERLLALRRAGRAVVENGYRRAVRDEGNAAALALLARVFAPVDAPWRGLGVVPASGLALGRDFACHDAARRVEVDVAPPREPEGCRCGDVLTGRLDPEGCHLFGSPCSPASPVGACMVSSEGACRAAHEYGGRRP